MSSGPACSAVPSCHPEQLIPLLRLGGAYHVAAGTPEHPDWYGHALRAKEQRHPSYDVDQSGSMVLVPMATRRA